MLVKTVQNPPDIIFNSNSASYASSWSNYQGSSGIIVPNSAITVTLDGNKPKVSEVIEITNQIKPTAKNRIIVKSSGVDTSKLTQQQVKLPVAHISQNPELPTGCEITSLATVLNFYGYNVSKTQLSNKYLDKTIDEVGDFWEVFVGDPEENGFGCYAKPIVNAANRFLASQNSKHKAVDYSGSKFEDLLNIVQNGTPVIIWSTMYDNETQTLSEPYATVEWNINGKNIQWISPEHCMVLIGYDLNRKVAILSDPQRNIVEYDLNTVKSRYLALHSQCVILEEIPLINGIEDGETYYTTQHVTIADYNVKSVTLNDKNCGTSFLIKGNAEAKYKIVVSHTDDTQTTYTVYTKPILSLLDVLNNKTELNVTLDDQENIKKVENILLKNNTKYSTIQEIEAVEKISDLCNKLSEKISYIESEIQNIQTTLNDCEGLAVQDINRGTLFQTLDNISRLTTTSNLTDLQQQTLHELYTKCNDLLTQTSDD